MNINSCTELLVSKNNLCYALWHLFKFMETGVIIRLLVNKFWHFWKWQCSLCPVVCKNLILKLFCAMLSSSAYKLFECYFIFEWIPFFQRLLFIYRNQFCFLSALMHLQHDDSLNYELMKYSDNYLWKLKF